MPSDYCLSASHHFFCFLLGSLQNIEVANIDVNKTLAPPSLIDTSFPEVKLLFEHMNVPAEPKLQLVHSVLLASSGRMRLQNASCLKCVLQGMLWLAT